MADNHRQSAEDRQVDAESFTETPAKQHRDNAFERITDQDNGPIERSHAPKNIGCTHIAAALAAQIDPFQPGHNIPGQNRTNDDTQYNNRKNLYKLHAFKASTFFFVYFGGKTNRCPFKYEIFS